MLLIANEPQLGTIVANEPQLGTIVANHWFMSASMEHVWCHLCVTNIFHKALQPTDFCVILCLYLRTVYMIDKYLLTCFTHVMIYKELSQTSSKPSTINCDLSVNYTQWNYHCEFHLIWNVFLHCQCVEHCVRDDDGIFRFCMRFKLTHIIDWFITDPKPWSSKIYYGDHQ